MSITHRIGNLTGLHIGQLLGHAGLVLFCTGIRHEVDHGRNSLGNRFGGDNNNILILTKRLCLICCQDDVLIVRQNEDMIRVYLFNGIEHILGAGVHGLTALDQVIHAETLEDLTNALADGY